MAKRKGTNRIGLVEERRYVSTLRELPSCNHAEERKLDKSLGKKGDSKLTSVGILEVPNNLEYWSMSNGVPRTISGSSRPARRSCIKPREETTREAARGNWHPRSGVGSFLVMITKIWSRVWKHYNVLENEVRIQGENDWITMWEIGFVPTWNQCAELTIAMKVSHQNSSM